MNIATKLLIGASAVTISCIAWRDASSAELPSSTKAVLQQLKLDPSILSDIDEELKVPADWMERARKEGQFKIAVSEDEAEFRKYVAPFEQRYPFIKIVYEQGSYGNRVTRPLVAFKQGRYLVDLTTSITGAVHLFNEVKALAPLDDIPNFHKVRPEYRPDNAEWTGHDLRVWCMGYNTKKIKKEWLPATWEKLLETKELQGSVVGINDRSQTWMSQLWNAWGPEKSTIFMQKLFLELRPQLRKEGVNALTNLSSLGEVPLVIPTADYRVFEIANKGGEIGWHCPDPVPVSVSEIALFRGAPNTYASKVFVNWLLSKEGQIAKYGVMFTPPVHKDLPLEKFLIYPNEVAGKKLAPINANRSDEQNEEVQAIWNPLWEKSMQTSR